MKTLTIHIFYLLLLISQTYAQQPNFFPIQIGNEYQFTDNINYWNGRIDRDSVYLNGKLYYTLPYFFEFGDTRVDSAGNILSISKPFFGGGPAECLVFKSDAQINEIWPIAWNFGPVIDTGFAKCIYDDTLYVFGVQRRVKGTLIFDASYYYYFFWLADGIGLIRNQYDDGSGLNLNYAKINGVEFGELVSNDEEFENIPTEFNISQNYPNPYNGITNIDVILPQNTIDKSIKLIIYNLLGSKIFEKEFIVNNSMTMTINTDEFNASSGTYIYSIIYKNEKLSKKFLLLK